MEGSVSREGACVGGRAAGKFSYPHPPPFIRTLRRSCIQATIRIRPCSQGAIWYGQM